MIGAALLARAAGSGHRSIGAKLGVPASTVRGWLRVLAGRLESVRLHLLQVARRAGVDRPVPKALGSPWRDVLAAVGAATVAVTGRFGTLRGPRPGDGLAGRCGVFGWSAARAGLATAVPRCRRQRSQHEFPLTRSADTRNPREGCCPAGPGRAVPY